jgi:hypothetical protein
MKSLAIASCAALLVSGAVSAQEFSHLAVNVGAGFTAPVGTTGRNLDYGWNARGGVGYNFNPWFGVLADMGYDSLGITSSVLNRAGFGGGNVNVFSATLDPIVHLNPKGHVDFYVTGGGGLYHRYQNFTQPGIATAGFFDPFFGFYPVAFQTNVIVASYSVNKPGFNIGAGVAIGTKWHGKFFAESRYNRMLIGNYHTDYVPVTFGFRW